MSTMKEIQESQPWTVPYSEGVMLAEAGPVPHILSSHNVLHAAKTVGKLAAVFEAMDHGAYSDANLQTIRDMSADLVTEAMRFANVYGFDLETEVLRRRAEKNPGASPIPPVPAGAPGLADRVLSIVCPVQMCRAPIGRGCGPSGEGRFGSICMGRLRAAARTGDQESGEAGKP